MSWTECGKPDNWKTRKFAISIISMKNTCMDFQYYFLSQTLAFFTNFSLTFRQIYFSLNSHKAHWLFTCLEKHFFTDFSLTTSCSVNVINTDILNQWKTHDRRVTCALVHIGEQMLKNNRLSRSGSFDRITQIIHCRMRMTENPSIKLPEYVT